MPLTVLDVINRGGFGRVERVKLGSGDICARKVFDPAPALLAGTNIDKLKLRFIREVQIQSKLPKEYFLPVLEANLNPADLWFVMPLAEKSLKTQIAEDKTAGIHSPDAFADILNALENLHALGYIHRDLKPDNVLLHEGRWKLSDLGLVLLPASNATTLTSTLSAWGTENYCAPEQRVDFHNCRAQADIYSFGCILHDYFGAVTRIPYQQHSATGPIGTVIEKCTDTDPRRRFRSITTLRSMLMGALPDASLPTPTPEATAWADDLATAVSWGEDKLKEFSKFLHTHEGDASCWGIYLNLDEERLEILHGIDENSWQTVGHQYASWCKSRAFDFGYCDVLIGRLEKIFSLGAISTKCEAILAAARLGASHNRWFVMQRLLSMAGAGLEEGVAKRVAIEIEVAEMKPDFMTCVTNIGIGPDAYHPEIARILVS